jgi:hypothetical protein
LLLTLTTVVRAVVRSWTKRSTTPLLSPPTRFVACESNAATSPFALIAGALKRPLMSSPCLPLLRTLTSSVDADRYQASAAAKRYPTERPLQNVHPAPLLLDASP